MTITSNAPIFEAARIGMALLCLSLVGCELLPRKPVPAQDEYVDEVVREVETSAETGSEPEFINEPVVQPAPVTVDNEMFVAQEILKVMGLYNGNIDGIYGPRTRKALLDYQYRNGLSLTGVLDLETNLSLFKTQ